MSNNLERRLRLDLLLLAQALDVDIMLVHAAVGVKKKSDIEEEHRPRRCDVGETDVYKPGTQNCSCRGNQKGRKGQGQLILLFLKTLRKREKNSGLPIGLQDLFHTVATSRTAVRLEENCRERK